MKNKNIINYNFQNVLPESARTQLSNKNRIKISIILITTFLVMFVFGFFIAKDKLITQIPTQLTLEISITFWAFAFYAINIVLIYLTRKGKYEIFQIEFILYELNNLFLFMGLVFLKNNVFGNISNGIVNVEEVNITLNNLRFFYFFTMLVIPILILIYTYWNHKKYKHIFIKSRILFMGIIVFLVAPWTIKNFNHEYVFGSEHVFIVLVLISLMFFSISVGTLAKIYSYGTNNQKSINQIFFPILNITCFGIILGILSRDINEYKTSIEKYNNPIILSIIFSTTIFVLFFGIIIFLNKISSKIIDSFKNKLLIKLYIIINLVITLFIIYFEPKFIIEDFFQTTILIVLFPITYMILLFIILSHIKIITFERMQILSITTQFIICTLIVFISGITYTLEESFIINKWLSRALWIIFLTFYLIIEIISFIPDIASILLIKKLNKKRDKNQNIGVKNV